MKFTVTVEIDPVLWAQEYAITMPEVEQDAASWLHTTLAQSQSPITLRVVSVNKQEG